MSTLNDDCVTVLFQFFSPCDLEKAALVCKDWLRLSREYDPEFVIGPVDDIYDADVDHPMITVGQLVFYINRSYYEYICHCWWGQTSIDNILYNEQIWGRESTPEYTAIIDSLTASKVTRRVLYNILDRLHNS